MTQFDFRWATPYRLAAAPFGVTPRTSHVRVGDDELRIRFGPWSLRTPLANVCHTEVTEGYAFVKAAGPARLSMADRGVTFATNGERGLCICFHEPVRCFGPRGNTAVTVTVDDIDGLARAVTPEP